MKRILLLYIAAMMLLLMCACGDGSGPASETGVINVTSNEESSIPTQNLSPTVSPPIPTDESTQNADKAMDNGWVCDISWVISEATHTEYGEKKLLSVGLKNISDQEIICFEFMVLLYDADGKPVGESNRMEFQAENVALQPDGIFDRGDQWMIPVETRQVKICVRNILYLDGEAKTWENPYIRDWFQAEKDAYQ